MDGAILAGGESLRMGRPKPFVELGGRPLISWVLDSLRSVCREVFIVVDRVEPYGVFGCRVVQDLIPRKGPMGGIYTALSSTGEREVFVTACDTPFLSPGVVRYLASQSAALGGSGGEGYEIVVPRLTDDLHPLQAIYAKSCLPRMHECLIEGRLSLIEFLQEERVRMVSEQEIRPLDPQLLSFMNINTPQDLGWAKALLHAQLKTPPPILCVVGPSGSGKTTLMEGLIRELSHRGYRVATIKRTHHAVELDQPEKDSWRHRRAGAVVSIISSPGLVAVFSEAKQELTVEELRSRFVQDADLILAEGYKDSDYPKMVVVGNEGWDAAQWTGVKAVVSNQRLDLDIPVFQPSDVTGIVTFLEYEFLGHLSGLSS